MCLHYLNILGWNFKYAQNPNLSLYFLSLIFSVSTKANPIKLGESALASNCGTSGVGVTLISAASNVAGVNITTGTITGFNQNNQTTLNAIYPDGTTRVIWLLNVSNSGANSTILPYPVFVPAGIALACITGVSSDGPVYLTYDLLAH